MSILIAFDSNLARERGLIDNQLRSEAFLLRFLHSFFTFFVYRNNTCVTCNDIVRICTLYFDIPDKFSVSPTFIKTNRYVLYVLNKFFHRAWNILVLQNFQFQVRGIKFSTENMKRYKTKIYVTRINPALIQQKIYLVSPFATFKHFQIELI